VLDAGEQCDDGNVDSTDNCTEFCLTPLCGDGFVHADVEECDLGTSNNSDTLPDTCRTNCADAFCGDGVQDSSEECDPQNSDDPRHCTSACGICRRTLVLPFDRLSNSDGVDDPNLFEDISGNNLTPVPVEGDGGFPNTNLNSKVNGNASVYFPWLSFLKIPHSPELQEAMNFGWEDFTIEFFKRSGTLADISYDQGIMGCSGSWDFHIGRTTAYFHSFSWSYTQTLDTWEHFAIVRHNDYWSLYIDGQARAQTGTQGNEEPVYKIYNTNGMSACNGDFIIGMNSSLVLSWWKGQMDDLRITKGEAVYTENFSPPTSTLHPCQ
jgi:hypothetical protein